MSLGHVVDGLQHVNETFLSKSKMIWPYRSIDFHTQYLKRACSFGEFRRQGGLFHFITTDQSFLTDPMFLSLRFLNDSNGQPPRQRAVSSTDGLTTVTPTKKDVTWSAQRGMEKMHGQTVPTKHLDHGYCNWISCHPELEH